MIKFEPESHKYTSIDPNDKTEWCSVTTLISYLHEKFDAVKQSEKSSKNYKSKWHKIDPNVIRDIWEKEKNRACSLGTWYHDLREQDLLACNDINNQKVIRPVYNNNIKIASDQKLSNGIYPEIMIYLKSINIVGQSDRVDVIDDYVFITDYKTSKEIVKESYKNWEGISKKMLYPVHNLDDSNYWHYALQLSLYMYMILKHNPSFKVGGLKIQHVSFEEEGKDEYGYPLLKYTETGQPILKEVIDYELPYLKNEVVAIINWYKLNKHKLK